jgi:hypothetical protein
MAERSAAVLCLVFQRLTPRALAAPTKSANKTGIPVSGYPRITVGKSEPESERHPFGVVAEAVALLRDVPDTRPRKVISQQAGPVLSQHGQHLDPTLGGLFANLRAITLRLYKKPPSGAA